MCECTRADKATLINAGFRYDDFKGEWYTPSPKVAARLREHSDGSAENEFNRVYLSVSPWPGHLSWPKRLAPKDWQRQAAHFALARNRSYLGLDPGLGKTVVAGLIVQALRESTCFIYVCPPSLALNVEEELRKWAPQIRISIYGRDTKRAHVWIVPDSLIAQRRFKAALDEGFAHSSPPLLFVDEAHRFKELNAKRTRALFQRILPACQGAIFMSGTPMPNRPMELYPVLAYAAPELIDFKTKQEFGLRYCAAYQDERGHWNYQGASRMDELTSKVLGKFMLRIRDTVMDLPPLTEELVFIGENCPPKVAALDSKILYQHSPEDLMGHLAPNDIVATYRKELAAYKVAPALPVIKEALRDGEALIVFAHHKEAIAKLTAALAAYKPMVIDGRTPRDKRVPMCKEFERDDSRRLMIINLVAGGVGLNIQKASRVIFLEYSWVPAENRQAYKRAHRFGQKKTVRVQYLVFKNSIDRRVLETGFKKNRLNQHL